MTHPMKFKILMFASRVKLCLIVENIILNKKTNTFSFVHMEMKNISFCTDIYSFTIHSAEHIGRLSYSVCGCVCVRTCSFTTLCLTMDHVLAILKP